MQTVSKVSRFFNNYFAVYKLGSSDSLRSLSPEIELKAEFLNSTNFSNRVEFIRIAISKDSTYALSQDESLEN